MRTKYYLLIFDAFLATILNFVLGLGILYLAGSIVYILFNNMQLIMIVWFGLFMLWTTDLVDHYRNLE